MKQTQKTLFEQLTADFDINDYSKQVKKEQSMIPATAEIVCNLIERSHNLEERIEKLEQGSKPTNEKPVQLPQDVVEFLKAITDICCSDIDCNDCQLRHPHLSWHGGNCLQNRAFELLHKYPIWMTI